VRTAFIALLACALLTVAPFFSFNTRVSCGSRSVNGMVDESKCGRCQRPNPETAQQTLPSSWEVVTDDAGDIETVICPDCLTGAEQYAIDADQMALDSALTQAGLGPDVDLEAMGEPKAIVGADGEMKIIDDHEYEMREQLAMMLYRHEPGADPRRFPPEEGEQHE